MDKTRKNKQRCQTFGKNNFHVRLDEKAIYILSA
jgi:hypothetical protein